MTSCMFRLFTCAEGSILEEPVYGNDRDVMENDRRVGKRLHVCLSFYKTIYR